MSDPNRILPATGAESLLSGLKLHGVDYLFANAGTDFPPLIEAMCSLPAERVPQAVTVPHETAGVGMAHGFYLVTGRPQAVMVHTNVGLANAAMGVINAASDNIPVLVMSGRTPITEGRRPGARTTPIHYGQEMYDQASLVADSVKFHYEMRFPEQGEPLVGRALAVAASEPRGPVYLGLPREPLAAACEADLLSPPSPRPAASPAAPDPEAVARLASWLQAARAPVLLAQRGDVGGRLAAAVDRLARRFGMAVCEPFCVRNIMPSDHPMLVGYDPGAGLAGADLAVIVDSDVPWIESLHRPAADCRLAHIGWDPHFARMPFRSYRTDMALACDPAAAIEALAQYEPANAAAASQRYESVAARSAKRRETALENARQGCAEPIGAAWLSHCIGEVMDPQAVVFSELGILPGAMALSGPNRAFLNPHAGGLGWALPAALGAQLADRDRLVIACMGDGSYIFANPTACHQIAEALELPVLVVIKNNGMWNAVRRSVLAAYPEGAAARVNRMPLTLLQPAPDYLKIAQASRAHTERVAHGRDLPAALARAIEAIRRDRRQAVLDINAEVSDTY